MGLAGIAVIVATMSLVRDQLPHTVPALLLLVPVVAASVIADWRVAVPVAMAAAIAYALAFLPPIGSVRVSVSEDMFVLVTFVIVSVVVGLLKGPRSRREQQRIDERRVVMLRGVSHDLRTPLSTIRTISSELLADPDQFDPTTRERLLGHVVDESARLERIVSNLLSASRVEAGSLQPALEPQWIGPILRRCVERMDRSATHVLALHVDPDLPEVMVDAVQIDQVVTNLIENSLRHTPTGSTVRVEARDLGDVVEVAIVDDGPGFTPDARSALDRGVPQPGQQTTGLGLTVCAAIVDAHGGTITVRDRHADAGARHTGACVAFTVPVARHAAADPARRG